METGSGEVLTLCCENSGRPADHKSRATTKVAHEKRATPTGTRMNKNFMISDKGDLC